MEIVEELLRIFDVIISSVCVEKHEVKDKLFDLMDKTENSVCSSSTGNVTYKNETLNSITVFNYEKFIESLPDNKKKGVKHCDFIVYSGKDFFICNELSMGVSAKSKWPKAWKQMQQTIRVLNKSENIKNILKETALKYCVFSFCIKAVNSPLGIADSFGRPLSLIKSVQEREWYPINQLGFHVFESNYIVYNSDRKLSLYNK